MKGFMDKKINDSVLSETFNSVPEFKFALVDEAKGDKNFIPSRAEPMASGWDCRAMLETPLLVKPFDYVKISLGFRAICPNGWWLKINPRSSTFTKKQLHALYGVADHSYEGQYFFCAQFIPDENTSSLQINPGDAIAQLIPVRLERMIVSEVSNEEYDSICKERGGLRGAGGFGSSDKGFAKVSEK